MKRSLVMVSSLFLALPCAAAPAVKTAPKAHPAVAQKAVKAAPVEKAPAKASADAEDPWANKKDLFVPPVIKPSTKVNLGRVERYKLPNGLSVIVVPRHEVPSVDVTMLVRGAGTDSNPLDKSGLADFTASMLRKGTAKRSADQIAQAIDFAGGSLDASADDEGAFVNCHARAKDLDLCFDLTSDIVENPTFPAAEMGEIHDQLMAGVEGAMDSPEALAAEHGANLFFGDDDPRGRPASKRSLGLIDRDALVKFHDTWYAPNSTVIAISGDLDAAKVRRELTKWFGGWKKHAVPPEAKRTLPAASGLHVRIVDKPDATQSAISVMGPGIAHGSPDYFATRLMNYSLGGGLFSSRLMKVVRSKGGKTYGASSRFDARRDAGPFTVSTFTRTDETGSTLGLVMGEIEKMQAAGPTASELAAAKGNLIGGNGLKLETGGDVARSLLIADVDGLDRNFVQKYPARLQAVTLKQAIAAAAAHLHPTALVIVGKADQIKPMLAKLDLKTAGPLEVVSYLDPVSKAERVAATAEKKAGAKVSPVESQKGQALLAEALKAKGGSQALAKVKDIKLTGSGTMSMQGQNLPITVTEYYLGDQAARQDISIGPQTITQVYAGGKAFMKMGGQVRDLPAEASASMKAGLWRDPNFILLHASAPGAKVAELPVETVGGAKYDVLKVIAPDGDWSKLLLDEKTHLISQVVYSEDGKEVRDLLADYHPAGGIAIPHHVIHEGGGQKIDIKYQTVEVNKGLPADAFKR